MTGSQLGKGFIIWESFGKRLYSRREISSVKSVVLEQKIIVLVDIGLLR